MNAGHTANDVRRKREEDEKLFSETPDIIYRIEKIKTTRCAYYGYNPPTKPAADVAFLPTGRFPRATLAFRHSCVSSRGRRRPLEAFWCSTRKKVSRACGESALV